MLQLGGELAERFETNPVPPMNIGLAFELGGDADRSIDWYEMAYRTGDPSTPYLGVLTVAENVRLASALYRAPARSEAGLLGR